MNFLVLGEFIFKGILGNIKGILKSPVKIVLVDEPLNMFLNELIQYL